MTLPSRPLELNDFDPGQIDVGMVRAFRNVRTIPLDQFVDAIARILVKYSSWTVEEIDLITLEELNQVGLQIVEKLREQAVPKSRKPSSKTGRGSRRRSSQTG